MDTTMIKFYAFIVQLQSYIAQENTVRSLHNTVIGYRKFSAVQLLWERRMHDVVNICKIKEPKVFLNVKIKLQNVHHYIIIINSIIFIAVTIYNNCQI